MVSREIEFRYDPEADAAYIYVIPRGPGRRVARSSVANVKLDRAAITIDFTDTDEVAGIEILGASRILPAALLSEESEAETE